MYIQENITQTTVEAIAFPFSLNDTATVKYDGSAFSGKTGTVTRVVGIRFVTLEFSPKCMPVGWRRTTIDLTRLEGVDQNYIEWMLAECAKLDSEPDVEPEETLDDEYDNWLDALEAADAAYDDWRLGRVL